MKYFIALLFFIIRSSAFSQAKTDSIYDTKNEKAFSIDSLVIKDDLL